jgi:hypothetical protein
MKPRCHPVAVLCLGLLGALGCRGPEVQRIEAGSSILGRLDVETSRNLKVRTSLKAIKTTVWVDSQGRVDPVMRSLTQHIYENRYDWETSISGTTDVWEITSDTLREPVMMVLRVRADSFRPVVSLFLGVSSPEDLRADRGVDVPPRDAGGGECLALFPFRPGQRHFVVVQSRQPLTAPYRIAITPADQFQL